MADVSRETVPATDPEVAARVFGSERLPALERYAGLLATEGVVRGLIGPREVPRLWDRHLINCGLLAPEIRHGARVADLGSGAGLPGLVLALARPDLRVTLIEPMARRVAFLAEAVGILSLAERVWVVRGRAEDQTSAGGFDVVTARAVAPLPRLLTWGLPLVAPEGVLLAMKGSTAAEEIEAARPELVRHGASAEVITRSVPGSSVTTVVRVVPCRGSGLGWSGSGDRRRGRKRS